MKKDDFTKKKLIDLLIKKATGFYYSEEQLELENKPVKSAAGATTQKRKNAKTEKYFEKTYLFLPNTDKKEKSADYFFKEIIRKKQSELLSKKFFKIFKKCGSHLTENEKSGCKMNVSKPSKGELQTGMTLVKKKISSHYVPPDMIAIKILFEIFDKEVTGDDIENLSDEELLKLKNKLLEELDNENK